MYGYIKHEDKSIVDGKEYTKGLTPFDALIASIINLLDILSWREIEIAFSRKIAHCLGDRPFYIVGVKHPCFMVSRIIRIPSEELKIAYLAHPISGVRNLHHPRISGFTGELNEFIKKRLRQENLVLFVPDTIDEKRIGKDHIGKDSYQYIPKLSNSWALPFRDDWLFAPIAPSLQKIDPLNPKDFKFQRAGKAIKSMISSILELLETKIISQINSRDHSLVELSRVLLVYRPYWCGTSPGGVEKEMEYNDELRTQYDQEDRKVIMISATEDIGKLNINTFFRGVNNIILDEITKNKVATLCEDWLYDPKRKKEFYERSWNTEDIRKSIEAILPDPNNYEFYKEYVHSSKSETLKPSALYGADVTLKECWANVFKEILIDDPLSKFMNVRENDELKSDSQNNLYKKIDDLVV